MPFNVRVKAQIEEPLSMCRASRPYILNCFLFFQVFSEAAYINFKGTLHLGAASETMTHCQTSELVLAWHFVKVWQWLPSPLKKKKNQINPL